MFVIEHNERKIQIDIVCQGLAWPGEKPGWIVVIGEAYKKDAKGIRHLYWLAESQENDTGRLIKRCLEFKKRFSIHSTYGRPHGPNMRFLDLWNRDSRKRGFPNLYVMEAPFTSEAKGIEAPYGLIEYHLNVIKDRLDSQNKNLHLLKSRLPYHLMEIQEPAKAKDTEHPAAAALGYVVSAMTLWQGLTEEDEEVQYLNESLSDFCDD